ncbi:MAG TPA: FAD-dependent oxidoreductase, partial [Xanthomonadaceae bacterium]|nr:FAD-dependent oxidoreductase [Xanthomonadaceae bacterium]
MADAASGTALVIGAGVIGHACALALQRQGWQVVLTDPDRAGVAASWGNAGHIATEQVEPLASPAMLRSAPRRLYAFGGALDIRDP